MTIWEVYDFPDDDGATFECVIEGLPGSIRRDMEERPCDAWVLSMRPTDVMALLLAIPDADIAPLDDHTLYLSDNARRGCIDALSRGSITEVEWRRLYAIEFRSKAARAAFEQYSRKPPATSQGRDHKGSAPGGCRNVKHFTNLESPSPSRTGACFFPCNINGLWYFPP